MERKLTMIPSVERDEEDVEDVLMGCARVIWRV